MRIIIVGKGGSGKDTLRNRMAEKSGKREISYTTRPPRTGEIDGHDYFFIDKECFENMIKADCFYEYNNFNGWYYGTTTDHWRDNELFIMTPSGVAQIKPKDRKNCFVIYLDINIETRSERLMKRGDADSVLRRLKADDKDFENFTDFDMKINNPFF